MLHNVTSGIGALTRNVVIKHPNTFNCELFRKVLLRKDVGEFVGKPTMGGTGVLESDDEEKYEYKFIGPGYALPAVMFEPAPIVDANDTNIGPTEFRFLLEPDAQFGEEGFWIPKTHDLVFLLIPNKEGDKHARLCFEVVGRETTTNIPPFNTRYICNRRDDLHMNVDGEFVEF